MRMARIALTALLILLCAATAALAADFGMAVLRGGNTRDFWVYNIRQASWEYMPSTPHSVGPGGSITFFHTDGCVYALRGGGTRDFWRFTPAFAQPGGTWTELQPTPGPVLDGGSLTAVNFGGPSAQQGLYALQGGGSRAAWQWRDGTWTMIYPRGKRAHFDLEGRLSTLEDPSGNRIGHAFETSGADDDTQRPPTRVPFSVR